MESGYIVRFVRRDGKPNEEYLYTARWKKLGNTSICSTKMTPDCMTASKL